MEDFRRISIIGMGLIGGSMAMALKRSGFSGEIVGQDLYGDILELAVSRGAIDRATKEVAEAAGDMDLIILATPIGHYEKIFKDISSVIGPETVVTDVGSVKQYVMDMASKYLPKEVSFVGGHPMAGSEKTGILAASPNLFENAFYFLTPSESSSHGVIAKIQRLIESIGAYPVVMDASTHDNIVSQISHIPHLVAAMLVNLLDKNKGISFLPYVGGGFRDTTRIASGSPQMWKDILLMNKTEIIKGITDLEEILGDFKKFLINDQHQGIMDTLSRAKEIRDSIPKHVKDAIPTLYEIILDVQDRPGALGEVTRLMGVNNISIKEIEIVHAREGKNGAVRLGFFTAKEQKKSYSIFKDAGYDVTLYGEERDN